MTTDNAAVTQARAAYIATVEQAQAVVRTATVEQAQATYAAALVKAQAAHRAADTQAQATRRENPFAIG